MWLWNFLKLSLNMGVAHLGIFPHSFEVIHIYEVIHINTYMKYTYIRAHKSWHRNLKSCFIFLSCPNPSVLGLGKEKKRNHNTTTKNIAKCTSPHVIELGEQDLLCWHLDLKSSSAKEHTLIKPICFLVYMKNFKAYFLFCFLSLSKQRKYMKWKRST